MGRDCHDGDDPEEKRRDAIRFFIPHLSSKPHGLSTGSSKSVLSTGFNTPWKGAGFIVKIKNQKRAGLVPDEKQFVRVGYSCN